LFYARERRGRGGKCSLCPGADIGTISERGKEEIDERAPLDEKDARLPPLRGKKKKKIGERGGQATENASRKGNAAAISVFVSGGDEAGSKLGTFRCGKSA